MYILMLLFACEKMETPGKPLQRIAIAAEKDVSSEVEQSFDELDIAPQFIDPQNEVIKLGEVEEPPPPEKDIVATTEDTEIKQEPVVEEEEDDSKQGENIGGTPQQHVLRHPARIKDGWMPTLLTTLTATPVPRAVLAMPSGEEIVVQAGDLLAEEGVIIMAIGETSVELAAISAEGGQAKVENITLASYYPE